MIEFIDHKTGKQIHLVRDDTEYSQLPRLTEDIHFLHEEGLREFMTVVKIQHIIVDGEEGWPVIHVKPKRKSILNLSLQIFKFQFFIHI